MNIITAESAIQRLIEGNLDYINDKTLHYHQLQEKRKLNLEKQSPFAVIITCSDSRVPAELIFHQSIGDLFVIRNAGNVVNDNVYASVEYAVKYLEVNLVLVMGHTSCGAIATASEVANQPHAFSDIIKKYIRQIPLPPEESTPFQAAVENNAIHSVEKLRKAIAEYITEENDREIKVVPAYYDFESGKVTLLEDV